MTKLDQLKALREGNSSRGSREAATGRPTRVAPVRASASKDARSGSINGAKGEPRRSVGERAFGGVATTPRDKSKSDQIESGDRKSRRASRSTGARNAAEVIAPPVASAQLIIRKGRPRLEDAGKTIEAAAPWVALNMSRRSWFRRRAEEKAKTRL